MSNEERTERLVGYMRVAIKLQETGRSIPGLSLALHDLTTLLGDMGKGGEVSQHPAVRLYVDCLYRLAFHDVGCAPGEAWVSYEAHMAAHRDCAEFLKDYDKRGVPNTIRYAVHANECFFCLKSDVSYACLECIHAMEDGFILISITPEKSPGGEPPCRSGGFAVMTRDWVDRVFMEEEDSPIRKELLANRWSFVDDEVYDQWELPRPGTAS